MAHSASDCNSCSDTSCAAKAAPRGESAEQREARQALQQRLCQIRNKILVMSGKGGVGKSTTAVNLALALAKEGQAVGLLDVDIHGPSIPKMLGIDAVRPAMSETGMVPVAAFGLKVMSLGLLLEKPQDAVIWRGAMKHGVIQQFIRDVDWGFLDYLVVDCPPGTGDEPLSVAQTLGSDSRPVIVTTPQEVALIDVKKSISFCRQLQLPILGVVENMSGFVCPHCAEVVDIFKSGGGAALAAEMEVPFLGKVPLDPQMVMAGDGGQPLVAGAPASETAKALMAVARTVLERTGGEDFPNK